VPHILTLQWSGPYTALDTQPYFIGANAAAWINLVEWQLGGIPPTTGSGVYIIENAVGQPVYAGRATNVKSRFDGRNAALHDYFITSAAAMPTHRVWWASVASVPGWLTRVVRAEQWLVRYLYRWDQLQAVQRLQNRTLLGPYPSPGGLRVQWNNVGLVVPPAYLVTAAPGRMAPPPAVGWVGYDHPANTIVL
jgi:hypothetical protein